MSDRARPSAAATLVDGVLDAIAEGRLPSGTKLGEDQLSRIYGVGRRVVREALKELRFIGVIELLPNRGAFVAQPMPRDAEDVYAARRIIETAIVAELARHGTANDIRALRQHLARQQDAETQSDRRGYIRLLGEFHVVLARLAGNPVLVEMLQRLTARTCLMTALYEPPERSCALAEHAELIDRLAQADTSGAAALIERHLTTNERRLRMPAATPRRVDLARVLAPPTKQL
jgi:DNA-binding GntR family transcriptional regulator